MALDFGVISSKESIVSNVAREFENATFVTGSNTASNASHTVYTVPAGYKFWLVSMILDTNYTAGTTGNAAYARIDTKAVIRLYGAAAAGTKMQTLGTNEMLELAAGVDIEIETFSANVFAALAITGYLLPEGT